MRVIDADALPRHGRRGGLVHWKDIENAPTIDAEPVVRCKDCRFHEYEETGMVWCPNVVGSWMAEDGFCSMGERREDGTLY